MISPLQQLTLAEAAFTPGHALHVGTRRKLASNLSACRAAGGECIPLVAETLGGLSEDSILTIRAIGRAIGLRSSAPDPTYHHHQAPLWQGCHRPVAWQCQPVVTPPPNSPPFTRWGSLAWSFICSLFFVFFSFFFFFFLFLFFFWGGGGFVLD